MGLDEAKEIIKKEMLQWYINGSINPLKVASVVEAISILWYECEKVDGLLKENAILTQHRKINVEFDGDNVKICRGDHERHEGCKWEEFIPVSKVEKILQDTRSEVINEVSCLGKRVDNLLRGCQDDK